ncbi:MAG: DUF4430 domain-containing protein [Coriobacteriales bacterium]
MKNTRTAPDTDQRIAPRQPRSSEQGDARHATQRTHVLAAGAVCAVAALLLAAGLLAGPQLLGAQHGVEGEPGIQQQAPAEPERDESAAATAEGSSPATESTPTAAAEQSGAGSQTQQGSSANAGAVAEGGGANSGSAGSGNAQSGGSSSSKPQPAQEITISFCVDASRAGSSYEPASVAPRSLLLPQGATAYDALLAAGVTIGGNSTYVSSINGLAEKQCGPLSGWMYSVDGVFPQVSCGKFVLEDGAVLVWAYTLDMGEDL